MTMAHHPLSLITFSLQFSNIIYTPKTLSTPFRHNLRALILSGSCMPFLPGLSRSRSSSSSHALPIKDEAKKYSLVFGILGSSKLELDSLYFRSYPITPRIHPFIPRRTITTTLPTTPSSCYLLSGNISIPLHHCPFYSYSYSYLFPAPPIIISQDLPRRTTCNFLPFPKR